MFIKIHCVDYMSDKETDEICLFRGVRYDRRTSTAILSTEHDRHDYIFPISEKCYEGLIAAFESAAKADAKIISLENGKVFRCKKGQVQRDAMQDTIMVVF